MTWFKEERRRPVSLCTDIHTHAAHAYTRSLSRESACELDDMGGKEMQMLLSSSQWHGVHGETNVWEKEGRWWLWEGDGADSLCPPLPVKEHARQAARIDDMVSGGRGVANKIFFVYWCFSFLFTSICLFWCNAPVPPCPRRQSAMPHPSLFSLFTVLCSLWVPCCFSCIVRLQVVWEQDLWEHMRVGETPWLTWLLRRRRKDRDAGRHHAGWLWGLHTEIKIQIMDCTLLIDIYIIL